MDEWQTEKLVPFGRYHLGARIATGGMGEVYLAKMKGVAGFEKRVVIKKILPQLSRDPEFVERFIDEGKLVVKLSHANIVPVLDLGEVDGEYYLTMEYVDGVDLRELLRRLAAEGRSLPLGLTLFILGEVCRGLHYAHQRTDDDGRPLHVIHRDISPANVMVSRDGAVRLVDFGIAKAADRLAHSVTGALQGKFVYMSPEQARGDRVDPRSDLFSLASMAYELLSGVRPFEGRTDLQTLERVKRAEPPPLSELRPDLPAPIVAAVHRALARDPADRFGSVDEFHRVLREQLFALDEPPGERELGAFVRDVVGARPTPAVGLRGRSLDELLAAELERARGGAGSDTVTASQEIAVPPTSSAAGAAPGEVRPGTATGTQTGTALSGPNRLLVGGLVAIIAILLYFNIRNLLEDRTVDPPPARPDASAGLALGPPQGPGPGPLAGSPDAGRTAAGAGDVSGSSGTRAAETALTAAGAPDGGGAPDAAAQAPHPAALADSGDSGDAGTVAARRVRLEGLLEGDEVLVGDRRVTPGPDGLVELPPEGEIHVSVQRSGHVPFEHTIGAAEQAPEPIAIEPRPARKSVLVRTEPEGATLAFDGREVGEAPKRAVVTFGRTVDVVATLPRYEPARATLRYGDAGTATLTLKPLRLGRVEFRFLPANAMVYLNGKRLATGASNRIDRELPPGPYRLLIKAADGTAEKRREFTIKPGETEVLGEISLTEP